MLITHNKENFFQQETIDFVQKDAILFSERSCGVYPQAERRPRTGMRGKQGETLRHVSCIQAVRMTGDADRITPEL